MTSFRVNGPALRVLREHLGWSINGLALEIETSRSHLSRVERGERDLSLATAQRIAGVLRIPVDAFFRREEVEAVA